MNDMIFCQSCGMPMNKPEDYGTEKDGSSSKDYCHYCYKDGEFTNKDLTIEEVIEFNIPYVVKDGIAPDEASARVLLQDFIPKLKRWA